MGRASRTKGHNYERLIASLLSSRFPALKIRRGRQDRCGGKDEPDVLFPGLHLETKRGKLPNPRAALRQAAADAAKGTIPIAIVRDDASRTVGGYGNGAPTEGETPEETRELDRAFVVLSLRNFLTLLGAWVEVTRRD